MLFEQEIKNAYQFKGTSFLLGQAMYNGQAVPGVPVMLPLKTMNRHGLIAGATGTGKTKTLQSLAEGLSRSGVHVFMMDIKGDLSGLGAPGSNNDIIQSRCSSMGIEFQAEAFPIELLTISDEPGARLRATVTEFGPVLFSKILGLNDTQEGVMSMIFKFCDDRSLPLIDLKDLQKVLQYMSNEGKEEVKSEYGSISPQSIGTMQRKLIELQQQKADIFFGEPSFDINDLMPPTRDGKGQISLIRLTDLQDRPKLFSSFMLQLLAELYAELPEAGDLEKPKLVMFIDEAHLIFQDATPALLQQLETVIKLIRSKGVGIFFCTQNPTDIPQAILSQLGMKIQHALRAFTAKDRQDIKRIARNYPETEFYQTEDLLTSLGIGEALVTLLNEKGIPSPLVHTMIVPPSSRMGVLEAHEIDALLKTSALCRIYNREMDTNSAYEILSQRMNASAASREARDEEQTSNKSPKQEPTTLETILSSPITKQVGRTAASMITRTLLGVLGFGTARSSRKKNSWF